jgi:hypothetical protein
VYGQVKTLFARGEAKRMRRGMHRAGIAGFVVGIGLVAGSIPAAAQSIPVIVNVPTVVTTVPVAGGGVTPTLPGLIVGVPGLGGGKATIEREITRSKEKATIVIAE